MSSHTPFDKYIQIGREAHWQRGPGVCSTKFFDALDRRAGMDFFLVN